MKLIKFFLFLLFFCLINQTTAKTNMTIYDFSLTDIDGDLINLSDFTGKPILIVNTASRCGFTPQYKDIQNLFIEYKNTDLTIIATTSNSFNQEYETSAEIKKICLINYKIGFITSSPMQVKGNDTHPIYSWLDNQYNKVPKWNFYKYLFDRKGNLIGAWNSITKPDSKKIKNKIDSVL